jgi:hypothetical protein
MNDRDDLAWLDCRNEDLWIFDKLILSRELGYTCGPAGALVPKPDFYIVRPITNVLGMGRNARIIWIESETSDLHPGEFWCQVFEGEHISVDYLNKEQILTVKGYRSQNENLYLWEKWEKVEKTIDFPKILQKLVGNYPKINCEFIGDHLIEVHLRHNPDFEHGNSVAVPVWDENDTPPSDEYRYIASEDFKRRGFFIK